MKVVTITRTTEKGFNKALNDFISDKSIKVLKIHYAVAIAGWSALIEYEEQN